MLSTASAQVCVPLGHSSLYLGVCSRGMILRLSMVWLMFP